MTDTPSPGWRRPGWCPVIWRDLRQLWDYVLSTKPEANMPAHPEQHVTHAQLAARLEHFVTEAELKRRLHERDRRIQAAEGNINLLGVVMSAVTDMVATLGAATNAISDKVTADHALLENVRTQLADALAGNPQAQADLDAAMAGMSATATTLQNLAASPSEPVPPSDPIVGTNGDTTAGEPGTEPPTV